MGLILGGTDRKGRVAVSFPFVHPLKGSRRRENCTDHTSPYARIRTFSQCASHTIGDGGLVGWVGGEGGGGGRDEGSGGGFDVTLTTMGVYPAMSNACTK